MNPFSDRSPQFAWGLLLGLLFSIAIGGVVALSNGSEAQLQLAAACVGAVATAGAAWIALMSLQKQAETQKKQEWIDLLNARLQLQENCISALRDVPRSAWDLPAEEVSAALTRLITHANHLFSEEAAHMLIRASNIAVQLETLHMKEKALGKGPFQDPADIKKNIELSNERTLLVNESRGLLQSFLNLSQGILARLY